MSTPSVLIIGASGAMGRYLVPHLAGKGFNVDAVALDIGVAQEKVKAGNFRILDEVVITEKYGIGFRKGNTALRDQVEKTLKEMVADGTAKKISEKYFDGRDCLIIGK